jgi:[1-hydroxy-2-(trimethylamino)ethyl]phosphonate dioxygenase
MAFGEENRMNVVTDEIFARLASRGDQMYGGEAVTQLQHALQCATLARREGASATLVAAALLHDYGHLVAEDEGAALRGVDRLHEEAAANHLAAWFPPAVTEPIHLHVAAKRYLCAVDPNYLAGLSPASAASLAVQGGPFSAEEALRFSADPHHEEAIRLRIWDDTAKDPSTETPPLADFRREVEASLAAKRR